MKEQIEEMAKDMCEYCYEGTCYQDKNPCDCKCDIFTDAQYLYAKGYRKLPEGKWEKRVFIIFDSEKVGYKCSECNTTWDTETNYCPNCGAKMKGENNE